MRYLIFFVLCMSSLLLWLAGFSLFMILAPWLVAFSAVALGAGVVVLLVYLGLKNGAKVDYERDGL